MSITQIFLILFLLFALSRVFLRFKSTEITFPGLIFWSSIFGVAIIAVTFPQLTSSVANAVGIGRGADAVVYIAIVLIFYLVFRLYVYIQDVRREISDLVGKLAIGEHEKENKQSDSNN